MAKHGDVKNHRQVIEHHTQDFTVISSGQSVTVGYTSEHTEQERFCEVCDKWVLAKGIMGALLCPVCCTPWKKEYIETKG